MKIKWLRTGRDDSDRIADHISTDNPVAAEATVIKIENAIAKLEAYPCGGRKGRIVGTRELVVPRSPYVVIYAVEQNQVAIVNIIHGAQQWPPKDE